MIRQTRRSKGLQAALGMFLCFFFSFTLLESTRGDHNPPLPKQNPNRGCEVEGLRASLSFFKWVDKETAVLRYSLRVVKCDAMWMLRRKEPIRILFWDSEGRQLPQTTATEIVLSKSFVRHDRDIDENVLFVAPPKHARFVSVALGAWGPVTVKVNLPDRPRNRMEK
jgi:hypothetical protein